MPKFTAEEAEEFSSNVKLIGDGWWRQILWADQQGIPKALGLTTREWVMQIGGYIRMNVETKTALILEMEAEGVSTRQTARVLGISNKTVGEIRQGKSPSSNHSAVPDDTLEHESAVPDGTRTSVKGPMADHLGESFLGSLMQLAKVMKFFTAAEVADDLRQSPSTAQNAPFLIKGHVDYLNAVVKELTHVHAVS